MPTSKRSTQATHRVQGNCFNHLMDGIDHLPKEGLTSEFYGEFSLWLSGTSDSAADDDGARQEIQENYIAAGETLIALG